MLRRLRNYLVNEGAKLIVLVLWVGVNASLFYFTFAYYYYGPEFYYLHEMLGYGLCISRATAACINLNACLILFPMCRNFLRLLRACPKICRQCRRLMDRSKSFHIACGYMLCLMSAIHCGAHAFNAFNFCEHFNARYHDVNVATFVHQNPILLVVKSVPGVTGLLMVAALATIAITASSPLRRNNYRRFWKIHHLFIAFYILLLLHACSGILKYQSNTDEHIPGCYVKVGGDGLNMTVILPEPEAEPHGRRKFTASVFAQPEIVVPELRPMPESHHHHVPEAETRWHALPEAEYQFHPMPESEARHHPMPEFEPEANMEPCRQPDPQFKSCPTEAWMWMSVPLFFYIIERISRYIGSSATPLKITKVVEHPNDVVELEFYQKNFEAQPGQSIWLRCPEISFVEAHPFTLTSIPTKEKPNFTIHMLALGQWTRKARELVLSSFSEKGNTLPTSRLEQSCVIEMQASHSSQNGFSKSVENAERDSCQASEVLVPLGDSHQNVTEKPSFYAHGPYGSAMQDVFRYEVSLCIAGGIGITPFAAVLNMILRQHDLVKKSKLQRIYLIWTCKTIKSFEWFVELINSAHTQLWNANRPDFLNVYLHVTSTNSTEGGKIDLHHPELPRCRLIDGRPVFKDMFRELSNRHQRTSVGVFCCGPKSLNDSVREHCVRAKGSKAKFVFNKESF